MSHLGDQEKLRTALSLHQAGKLDQAAALYRQLISGDPKNIYALHYLGVVEASRGNFAQAESFMGRSVAQAPPNVQFVENYATVLFEMGKYRPALEVSQRGLQLDRANVALLYICAISLYKLKEFEEALLLFDKLLLLTPDHVAALNERGSVLAAIKKYDAALAGFDKALALQPRYAEAHLNKGNVFGALKRYDEAFAAYDAALALNPNLATAWAGRGNVLRALKRYNEASLAYDKALSLNPDLVEAWLGRANNMAGRGSYDEALLTYDKALALDPDLAEAWLGRGTMLTEFRRYDEALAACNRAVELKHDLNYAAGARLMAKLYLCDWTNLETDTARLLSAIRAQVPASSPFSLLAIPSSAHDQLQCASLYVQDQPAFSALWRGEVYPHDRIRLAYLSYDFHEHAVAYLTAGLFEHHDKSRFETTAISFGPDLDSPMRRRLRAAFEHFIDVGHQSDEEIADLVRRYEIDVAVDLMGLTGQNRLAVLARRAAPIQVNYLGYSGTTAASYMDYIIADPTIIPEDQCEFYAEQVVWLPESFMVNDNLRPISERTPTRAECGLPESAFVFCCFNNVYKLMPDTFQIWMRLLKATSGSVLWLSELNATAQANLRREAERCGVAAQRLVFAPRMAKTPDHLARQRQADLFLDTLPYNAHTTASDALWAGVPVVTCLGTTFAGRVAASLLKAIGLDELIAHSPHDYEALALKLAGDSSYLASVKERLARNRNRFPLFDTERSTRKIEAAYMMMWERYRRGETPGIRSGEAKPIRIA